MISLTLPYQHFCKTQVKWSESRSVVSSFLWPHELYSPWNSSGQNTGVGSLFLLQGIFPGLLHCRWILYQLSHKRSPGILELVAYPFSSGSSQPRNWAGSPAWQADSLALLQTYWIMHAGVGPNSIQFYKPCRWPDACWRTTAHKSSQKTVAKFQESLGKE